MKRKTFFALAFWALGCRPSPQTSASAPKTKPVVSGPTADLRVSPDGAYVTFLKNPKRPTIEGVPPPMLLGELTLLSSNGGEAVSLGSGVTNLPGGQLFSGNGRWLLFLTGYNVASQSGKGWAVDLQSANPGASKISLGDEVSYLVADATGEKLAVVDGGKLKAGSASALAEIASNVTLIAFSADAGLVFKRNLDAGAGLYRVAALGTEPVRMADHVADFSLSRDGQRLAFTQHSTLRKDTMDLWTASTPRWELRKVASGVQGFSFSPDGHWLARVQDGRPDKLGQLVVTGADDKTSPPPLAENVKGFEFSPTGAAIALLANYNQATSAGALHVAESPFRTAKKIGTLVPNFLWGNDGKHLLFLSRFLKPVFSVDLMHFPVGASEAQKLRAGVFGYQFLGDQPVALFRSDCIRDGRECNLYRSDLNSPATAPTKVADGIYHFKPARTGAGLLLSYAKTRGDLYDVFVGDAATGKRVTVAMSALWPAHFVDREGKRVVYARGGESAGVYLASP